VVFIQTCQGTYIPVVLLSNCPDDEGSRYLRKGRAMAQAVTRRPLTAEARV
jgi:hypothetical protein